MADRHITTRTPEDCPGCGQPAERVWSGPEGGIGTSFYRTTTLPQPLIIPVRGLRCQVCGAVLPEKKEE